MNRKRTVKFEGVSNKTLKEFHSSFLFLIKNNNKKVASSFPWGILFTTKGTSIQYMLNEPFFQKYAFEDELYETAK